MPEDVLDGFANRIVVVKLMSDLAGFGEEQGGWIS
jgi:hypothetical protein